MKSQLASTLRANAIFSAAAGAILLVLARFVAERLGFERPWVLMLVGAGLLVFAVDLALLSRRTPIAKSRALLVVASDVGWVFGSLLALFVWPQLFNSFGRSVVFAVAFVVAGFAILQIRALKHEAQPERSHP